MVKILLTGLLCTLGTTVYASTYEFPDGYKCDKREYDVGLFDCSKIIIKYKDGFKVKYWYAKKYIVASISYKNGVRNGITKKYYNGKLSEEIPYKNNKIDGIVILYDDNAQIESNTPYKNGKKDGVTRGYSDGELIYEIPYKNGHKDGIEKNYRDGKLIYETPYKNGKKNGETTA